MAPIFLETIIIFLSGATSGTEITLFTFKIKERKEDPRGSEYKVTLYCRDIANVFLFVRC